jgi:DNA-binding cell septation regulator SpoVG
MKITVEWFSPDKPQFNVSLSTRDGVEPFLTIKGCRLVDGAKGVFVSWPATKNTQTGKYWQHVYSSDAFSVSVIQEAQASKPRQSAKPPAQKDASADMPNW